MRAVPSTRSRPTTHSPTAGLLHRSGSREVAAQGSGVPPCGGAPPTKRPRVKDGRAEGGGWSVGVKGGGPRRARWLA